MIAAEDESAEIEAGLGRGGEAPFRPSGTVPRWGKGDGASFETAALRPPQDEDRWGLIGLRRVWGERGASFETGAQRPPQDEDCGGYLKMRTVGVALGFGLLDRCASFETGAFRSLLRMRRV